MTVLGFERRAQIAGGRRVRNSIFERRSQMPVSAACLVGTSVRETLSVLFDTQVRLRLLEPVLPDQTAWERIAEGARIYAVRGPTCDAAFVLRPGDAVALASAAFGETKSEDRDLSALEDVILTRVFSTLSDTLAPFCGKRGRSLWTDVPDLAGFVTYFELLLEHPIEVRIGIALSREPDPETIPSLSFSDLAELQLDLTVEIAHGFSDAAAMLDLRTGSTVELNSRIGDAAVLRAEQTEIARGEYGETGGCAAFLAQ